MKRSQLFIKTLKETPADSDSINASLLTRGCFIQKQMAGVYSLLPLGYRVYIKVVKIIEEEMNAIGGEQILMNVLQPKELWQETGRWDKVTEVMYQFKDSRDKEIGLAPTHEEQVIDIARHHTSSYKDLPLALYQIQTKFRNEPRPKSGLLRGREFMMKDMYSFHIDEADFKAFYQKAIEAYYKIFKRCGIETKLTEATGGMFSKYSDEFQAISKTGEDAIFYCDSCDFSQNKEIAKVSAGDKCPKCDGLPADASHQAMQAGEIVLANSIEVGNIFPLSDQYSKKMNATVLDKNGKEVAMIMGCYGIGITRLIGTVVEILHDDYGIIWPESIAPFKVNLISLGKNDQADKIYHDLSSGDVEVLYDDRDEISAGEKFADADLIGCPIRIVVSDKSIKAGGAEISFRNKKEQTIVKKSEIFDKIKK